MATTHEIRRRFLEYFRGQGHAVIPSSPVVPHADPTLLFTNAGMNQFKDVFLGQSPRDYTRATTSQKCIRVGGKHNDLDNVGHTRRHLTFFEMLGNFSFGDYGKEAAITFAWEVATTVFGFDPTRIVPTVFRDDDEAFGLWTRYVPENRIYRLGEKDNFWAMGDVGPCGPCSELLYDRGEAFGTATDPIADTSGERFLEFWNLVFMQYNRGADGALTPLPKLSIDTGSGLERVLSLIQGSESVYGTDVLCGLIAAIEEASGRPYHDEPAFRVIADHLRCLAFAIADGAQPSNTERGYVLRKVLRRAVRYGRTLGFEEPFLARLLPRLNELMGADYKELITAHARIAEICTTEEEAFLRTLKRGGALLTQIIEASAASHQLSGTDAFKLKDTYGLPLDEIQLIAKDSDLTVDVEGFQRLELQARELSKAAHKRVGQTVEASVYANAPTSTFVRTTEPLSCTVVGLIVNGQLADTLTHESEGVVLLDNTPYYAEMGGQVGDTGTLGNEHASFAVTDCQAPYKGVIAHTGKLLYGTIRLGDTLTAHIDTARRQRIANNHTATHLLHYALHEVLGAHTRQAGSVVDADHLRFDFAHHKPLTEEEIRAIEQIVNSKIRENSPVQAYELPYSDVQKRADIKQFFGDKYGTTVRVIDIAYSKELCGGTHTSYTGTIGLFRITRESSIAAGIRRIEAVTGEAAEAFTYATEQQLAQIAALLQTTPQKLLPRLQKVLEELHTATHDLKALHRIHLRSLASQLLPPQPTSSGVLACISCLAIKPDELRLLAEELALPSGIVALGCEADGKAHLLVRVTPDLVAAGRSAAVLLKAALPLIDGKGGGKADMAQGAGSAPTRLEEALVAIRQQL